VAPSADAGRLAAAVACLLLAAGASGCTTTQQTNERLRLRAERELAKQHARHHKKAHAGAGSKEVSR
jgi:hypothetical protein